MLHIEQQVMLSGHGSGSLKKYFRTLNYFFLSLSLYKGSKWEMSLLASPTSRLSKTSEIATKQQRK